MTRFQVFFTVPPMPNILVTTFGATWQIVPEVLGLTNPGLVDLYANHPDIESIRRSRRDAGIGPADEVWLITTRGERKMCVVSGRPLELLPL
ncbi:MAG: hypothetical protein JRI84_15470 [Deltaproteobacteria bacterium]|nr:hypothetical protein [Deltaproteobacteria bacterium]